MSELGYLFLTSLHRIASYLDVRDHCHGWMILLDDVKSCNTIRICYYTYNAYYSKGLSVKKAIHSLLDVKIMNKSASESPE